MKQIDISEETYNHLLKHAQQQGLSESAVSALADTTLRQVVVTPRLQRPSADAMIASFREFRGSLQDTTIADIVADRHSGLR